MLTNMTIISKCIVPTIICWYECFSLLILPTINDDCCVVYGADDDDDG